MKRILLLLITLLSFLNIGAQKEISGIVSDKFGILPDANILNQTTKKGTASDAEGNFVIEADKNDILAVSYVGYKTVELNISDFRKQTIKLEIENSLDEVVVTAQSIKRVCRRIVCSWKVKTGCQEESRHSCNAIAEGVKIETVIVPIKERIVLMYPNPSKSGVFNLKVEQPFSRLKIEVFTLSGQLILQENVNVFSNKTTIDLSNYPNGMYIINYEIDGEKQMPKKVIIG